MSDEIIPLFYMCPHCWEPAIERTPCPRCGGERIVCQPGQAGDPRRRPGTAASGEIVSRAPIWWLEAIEAIEPIEPIQ